MINRLLYNIEDDYDVAIEKLSSNIRMISFKKMVFKESVKFKILCIRLQKCITLQIIDICQCKFEKNAFEFLMSYVVRCPSLGWLFLSFSNLNDNNAQYIANKFCQFNSLTSLNLKGNPITEKGERVLCDNIFRCPTLIACITDNINQEISLNLQKNRGQISDFHSAVMNSETAKYNGKLAFFPTLINSFHKGKTLLHYLVIDDKHTELLINILKIKPNPYLTDMISDKLPLDIAVNQNIIIDYMDLYYKEHN